MASILTRSSFQKLGLASSNLLSTFSSLSSSLSSLRTETNRASGSSRTLRQVEQQAKTEFSMTLDNTVLSKDDWNIYSIADGTLVSKWRSDGVVEETLPANATIAIRRVFFEQGGERMAFQCTEATMSRYHAVVIKDLVTANRLNGMIGLILKASGNVSEEKYVVRVYMTNEDFIIKAKNLDKLDSDAVVITGLVQQFHFNGYAAKIVEILDNGRVCIELFHPFGKRLSVRNDCVRRRDVYNPFVAFASGSRLIAKEAKFEEILSDTKSALALVKCSTKVLNTANIWARRFTKSFVKLMTAYSKEFKKWQPATEISFLPCTVYHVLDPVRFRDADGFFTVESELEGVFTKWNNNNGTVNKSYQFTLRDDRSINLTSKKAGEGGGGGVVHSRLDRIVEDNDEEDEEDDDNEFFENHTSSLYKEKLLHNILPEIPQCFSHFTYEKSHRELLVCDIQGVWNAVDGFTLTDPAILSADSSKYYGPTDKGSKGIEKFFDSHKCSYLCKLLLENCI